MFEQVFQAMGGTVELQFVDRSASDAGRVRVLFEEYEQCLSRFLPWSELSALNASAGTAYTCSSLLFAAVNEALAWTRATNGIFDPTVIDVLEASGYDRTFEAIEGGIAVGTRPVANVAPSTEDISLDSKTATIRLSRDVRIDLGGIGKGFTIDRAIAALGHGANAMVNASGDLFAAGSGPQGEGWIVGVQDPASPERDLATLRIRDRGVATSASIRRHWDSGHNQFHHLIDSRTRHCSDADLVAVTVVASTATRADVLAKTAFLRGSQDGLSGLARFGAEGLAVRKDGSMLWTNGMRKYLT